MRVVREATIHCQADLPDRCLRQIVATFVEFARARIPREWPPIPESETLLLRRVPEGYRMTYSVEVES